MAAAAILCFQFNTAILYFLIVSPSNPSKESNQRLFVGIALLSVVAVTCSMTAPTLVADGTSQLFSNSGFT